MVLKNLKYQFKQNITFDLKGVGRNRRVDKSNKEQGDTDKENEEQENEEQLTLWDQNFREWTQGVPLCLPK